MSWADLSALALHFLTLSVLAVGGAMSMASDMHRFMVDERGWISDEQFTQSIVLAQTAPGPNVLFVALLGWEAAGLAGALVTMTAIMLPASGIVLVANRWRSANLQSRLVRAIRLGLSPVAIGLTFASGWVIAERTVHSVALALLTLTAILVLTLTRINPLWVIALGAVMGALDLI